MRLAEQLRKSILQSAVQGKLTNQYEAEGFSNELIDEIDDIKEKLIKERKLRKEPKLDLPLNDDLDFDLPDNWTFVHLGRVTSILGGKRIPAGRRLTTDNTGYKYIRVTDMKEGSVSQDDIHYITKDIYEGIKNYTISKDDIYITVAGTIGRVGTIPEFFDNSNLTENANKIKVYSLDKNWLKYTLESPFVQNQIENFTTKVGQPKLAIKRIKKIIIPLPPLNEQKRIVSKIEKILPLLSTLETQENSLNDLDNQLPDSLRRSILQFAMEGKLINNPVIENTKELLEEIIKTKAQMVRDKIIRAPRGLTELKEDNIPFDIPDHWNWVKLGDIIHFRIGKTPPRAESRYWGNDVPWVSISDMDSSLLEETEEFVTTTAIDESFNNNITKAGTLIMSFKLSIGKTAILDIDAVHNEAIISIYPYVDKDNILRDYLLTILPVVSNTGDMKSAVKGNTLNSTSINNLLIPFPPFNEQKQIVEKVNQLFAEIDLLESNE